MATIARRHVLGLGVGAVLATAAWGRERRAVDVLVYGATASGVLAAVAAVREGRSVLLLDPARHIGGMVTGGLSATDKGNIAVIGGLTRRFFAEAGKHYGEPVAWQFEPSVASAIFKDWLRAAGIAPLLAEPIVAVEKTGSRIMAVRTGSGAIYRAAAFIDATYEGDLMAMAGVSHVIGREGQATYGEALAGRVELSTHDQFWAPIDPYDAAGNLLPLINRAPSGAPGAGDRKVQSYNYRICVSCDRANQVPFPKPPGYDPGYFALLARYLGAAGSRASAKDVLMPVDIHGGKLDLNNNGPISTDYLGESWTYPEAKAAERALIAERHRRYNMGLLYFLANDASIPGPLRDEINQWGLARDEFVSSGNFPPQLYVREARRMIGAHVMTQTDVERDVTKADAIAMGSFPMDSHHFQRVASPAGTVVNEGFIIKLLARPYHLPYRCITPQRRQCTNLLVTICCSASHAAYSSIRMEPQYMMLGEAAGLAAALAARERAPVQDMGGPSLRDALAAKGVIFAI